MILNATVLQFQQCVVQNSKIWTFPLSYRASLVIIYIFVCLFVFRGREGGGGKHTVLHATDMQFFFLELRYRIVQPGLEDGFVTKNKGKRKSYRCRNA